MDNNNINNNDINNSAGETNSNMVNIGGVQYRVYDGNAYGQMGNNAQPVEMAQGYDQQVYDQPGYNQQMYNQQMYNQQVYNQQMYNQAMNKKNYISPEDNKKANKLSLISLALFFGPSILTGVIVPIVGSITEGSGSVYNMLTGILSMIDGSAWLASIIIMIIVRVKYPKNVFGKVIMWIYILLIILSVVLFAIVMISCAIMCRSCQGM